MSKNNKLRKIAAKINQFCCTITHTPAVLLHKPAARCGTITQATGAEINAIKLQMEKSAVPLHIQTQDAITEYCRGDIKLAMMLHNLTHVRRYRKWWQIWKPRSWIEPRDSAVPLHIHGGNRE